jgi:hypothetical protein
MFSLKLQNLSILAKNIKTSGTKIPKLLSNIQSKIFDLLDSYIFM